MIQAKKYRHRAALQKTPDTQGIEIVDNQKESVLGRKQLADRTKGSSKRIPDDEKLNSFTGLLKACQTEIDTLTKRSKVLENAFINLYKVLAEAPDSYLLFEAAVVRPTHLLHPSPISHVRRIKQSKPHKHWKLKLLAENDELRQSSSALDASKRRVGQLEVRMDGLVAQKKFEINAACDERMRNYNGMLEQDLQRQVALYKNQVRDLRLSNE
ncbi:hypothetical protein BDR07DRAFT_1493511 [Suillus spraguei]|nr:hypothetical protein BDR07DRAFT_1493511 [Suillus spraguei]